jgi:hypothetical protein
MAVSYRTKFCGVTIFFVSNLSSQAEGVGVGQPYSFQPAAIATPIALSGQTWLEKSLQDCRLTGYCSAESLI